MPPDPVEAIYNEHCQNLRHSTAPHLRCLRDYAAGRDLAIEFGTQHGATAAALLMGARRVISYDIARLPRLAALEQAAGDRWTFRQQSSLEAPVTPCDLLFIDSAHTFVQVAAELARHADVVKRWLIFHDSITFGSIGADGNSGMASWIPQRGMAIPREHYGIRLAIDYLQIRDQSWQLAAHYHESHGLLVLERR